MQTLEQIRAKIEAAKAQAKVNFERNMGQGSWDRLTQYREENNARALNQICAFLDRKDA